MSHIRINHIKHDSCNSNVLFIPQHPMQPPQNDFFSIEDPRVVQRLVNNLMYLFDIKPGDYLTFILNQGHCTQNKDALKNWVISQLQQETIDSENILSFLVNKLKRQLTVEIYS